MKSLTPRIGFGVHFTVRDSSLSLPTDAIDDKTKPDDLLAQLFTTQSGNKIDEVHVTLECGPVYLNEYKHPHRYWFDPPNQHELKYSAGDESRYRWNTTKLIMQNGDVNTDEETDEEWQARMNVTEAEVRVALDEAMAEVRKQLLDRAKIVLDAKGNL